MTDEEKFKEFCEQVGLPAVPDRVALNGSVDYEFKAKTHSKISGYTDFVVFYTFDSEGNFIEMCIAE